jgi:outer membrane usher protein
MPNRSGRTALFTALCLSGMMSGPARANPPASPNLAAPMTLYLELLINGDDRQSVIKLIKDGNVILASPADLRRAGILPDGWVPNAQGQINLSAVKTIHLDIDMREQTVNFQIGPKNLAPNVIALHARPAQSYAPSSYDTGAYLNYDLSALDSNGIEQLAGQFGANGFSPDGDLRTEFQTNLQNRTQPGSPPDFTRLGTAYEYDWPDVPRSFIAGDFVSDSLPWTRAQLMGGIQIETNYNLQPGVVTFPVPSVGGTLAVPSAVNLLVNNAANYQSNEQAGPFSMVGIPVLTGLNEITVQTRAPDGQIVTSTVPFYASANLLRPGLTAYALNIGALRHDYGAPGDGYANWAASGTVRHGLTDNLTLDLHAEGAGNVQMAGLSLDATSVLGELDGTLAASNRNGRHAGLASANWTRSAQAVSFSLGATYAQSGFADLGTDLNVAYPHFSWYASAATDLPDQLGSLSLAYTSEQLDQNSRSQFLIGSYNVTTLFGVTLAASLFAGLDHQDGVVNQNRGFEMFLNVPLGQNVAAEGDAQGGSGQMTDTGETVTRQIDPDGGYGWSVANQNGQYSDQSATGQLYTHEGDFTASVQRYNNQNSAQVTANGSVVLLDGLYLSSPAYQSFGVVNVGYPDIPVYLENRLIGTTGKGGTLLVQNLQPYEPNKISIDASKLPMSVNLNNEDTVLTPPMNGGVVAQFPLDRNIYRVLIIETANGAHPAPGSLLELDGAAAPLVIGYDGEVELENPGAAISGKVILKGQNCRINGKLPPEARLNDMKGVVVKCRSS